MAFVTNVQMMLRLVVSPAFFISAIRICRSSRADSSARTPPRITIYGKFSINSVLTGLSNITPHSLQPTGIDYRSRTAQKLALKHPSYPPLGG